MVNQKKKIHMTLFIAVLALLWLSGTKPTIYLSSDCILDVLIAQSCLTLFDPVDCRLLCPWDSLGKRILEGAAMPSSRESSQPRDWTQLSHIAGGFFTVWATTEALYSGYQSLSRNIICKYFLNSGGCLFSLLNVLWYAKCFNFSVVCPLTYFSVLLPVLLVSYNKHF